MTDFEIEWNRMINGEIYNAVNPEFFKKLEITRLKLWEFNNLKPSQTQKQAEILHTLFGSHGTNMRINQPFRCDFGCNIFIGNNFFANFNPTILDEGKVSIGDNVFIGPNVNIFTACHPIDPAERNTGVEWAEPVTIGNNVWIGGGATILPGITIGNNVVIGAGSVVTKNISGNSVAAGNPARIIKHLTPGNNCHDTVEPC